MKKAVLFMFVVMFYSCTSYAKVFKYERYVGKFSGIEVVNFKVEGKQLSAGSTITAEYDLINTNNRPVKLGRYGAFIACRGPNYKNRDFGHSYRNYTIRRHKKIHIKGTIKIDKKGVWIFWPGLYVIGLGWGPSDWGAIRLNVKKTSHKNNNSGGSHHSHNPKKITLAPPFTNCAGWKISPGVAQTNYYCNPATGYIGIFDSSLIGGASSYAVQYIHFNSPRNQRVTIKATFYYTGGTKTAGIAAFAGLQAMYQYGNHHSRKDIIAGLDYNIIAQKIIDIAMLAVPGVKAEDVREALETISTIRDTATLLRELKDLYYVKKAKKYVYTFHINAKKGSNFVAIGIRGNCSGMATGSSYVVVVAQLIKVEILF